MEFFQRFSPFRQRSRQMDPDIEERLANMSPEIRKRLRDNYDEDIPEDLSLLGGQILRTEIGDESRQSLDQIMAGMSSLALVSPPSTTASPLSAPVSTNLAPTLSTSTAPAPQPTTPAVARTLTFPTTPVAPARTPSPPPSTPRPQPSGSFMSSPTLSRNPLIHPVVSAALSALPSLLSSSPSPPTASLLTHAPLPTRTFKIEYPKFAGAEGDNLETWDYQMGLAFGANSITSADAKFMIGALALKEPAASYIASLDTKPTTFEGLIEQLKKRTAGSKRTAELELEGLAQGSDTIGIYAAKAKSIFIRISDMEAPEKLRAIKRGLNPALVPYLAHIPRTTSFDDLVSSLAEAEATLRSNLGASLATIEQPSTTAESTDPTIAHLRAIFSRWNLCTVCGETVKKGGACHSNSNNRRTKPISARRPTVHLGVATCKSRMFFVSGTLAGKQVKFLVDTGASDCFVSPTIIKFNAKSSIPVTLADGSSRMAKGPCRLQVRIENAKVDFPFLCLDMPYDAILGLDFLETLNLACDWRNNTLIPLGSTKTPVTCNLVSAQHVDKDIEEGDQVYLMSIESTSPFSQVKDPDLKALLEEYKDVFPDKPPERLPPDRGASFRITLRPDTTPVVRPMRRLSPADMESLTKEISTLLENGLIRPSESPFGAQVLFVDKKDGSRRMCIDYRSLNEGTVRDSYPLPLIDEIFDRVGDAKIFTKLDLRSGYHQMLLHPDDTHKTAFRTPLGAFEFLVLPFGLCNAPGGFVRMMDKVFPPWQHKTFLAVYIDDLLIFSKTMKDHVKHLRIVLSQLRESELYIKGSKCDFGASEVEYLGFKISRHGISSDPAKVEAIQRITPPTSVPELRSFLGAVNYFHRFIHHFAESSGVLNELLKKEIPYVWTSHHQSAFEALKKALSDSPVLRSFNQKEPIVVQTDASDFAIGAVLLQGPDDDLRPVAFLSRTLKDAETRYSVQEKEALAVVVALTKWEHYLRGCHFVLETDHQSLIYAKKSPDPSPRIARWMDTLAEYDYTPRYRKGDTNVVADYLSRFVPENQVPPVTAATVVKIVVMQPEILESIKAAYKDDPYFDVVYKGIVQKEIVPRMFEQRLAMFYAADGLLYFQEDGQDRLAIPLKGSHRLDLMREAHESASAGHLGIEATYGALRRRFFWPRMAKTVARFVQGCIGCQRTKVPTQSAKALLRPLPVPEGPWDSIGMDFVTGLPEVGGINSILTVVDRFSKMCHFLPTTKSVTAKETADLFIKNIFRLHGLPKSIVSDRDPKFTSEFWTSLFERLGTKLLMSTADHPQTDGQSEKANGYILSVLRALCFENPSTWVSLLPMAEFAINNAISSATGASPFRTCSGRNPLLPLDLLAPQPPVASASTPVFVRHLQAAQSIVRDKLIETRTAMAERANEGRGERLFKVGDQVLLKSDHLRPATAASENNKISERFSNPLTVTKTGPGTVTLDLKDTMTTINPTVNVDKVKAFIPPVIKDDQPDSDDKEEYEIERILNKRLYRNKVQYLVRWKGWSASHDQWLSPKELGNAKDVLADYEATQQPARASSRGRGRVL